MRISHKGYWCKEKCEDGDECQGVITYKNSNTDDPDPYNNWWWWWSSS